MAKQPKLYSKVVKESVNFKDSCGDEHVCGQCGKKFYCQGQTTDQYKRCTALKEIVYYNDKSNAVLEFLCDQVCYDTFFDLDEFLFGS